MNDRQLIPLQQNEGLLEGAAATPALPAPGSPLSRWPGLFPAGGSVPVPQRKSVARSASRKEPAIVRDSLFLVRRGDAIHVVSEDYSYKSDAYYTILRHELEGDRVFPSSMAVLDAFVVPICLEKARMAGIPVCDWGISQAYVPLPAVLYGLNYFATAAEHVVADNNAAAQEAVRHLTNKGKYPFCYQKLPEGATVQGYTAVFGRAPEADGPAAALAARVYELFPIPLMQMVCIGSGNECLLSSLAPVPYSRLSAEERSLLAAYLSHQEFL